MDMKYDSQVMNKLLGATEARVVEGYNAYLQIKNLSDSINTNLWNDAKKKEFELCVSEINESLKTAVNEVNSYLQYLKEKMIKFEFKG